MSASWSLVYLTSLYRESYHLSFSISLIHLCLAEASKVVMQYVAAVCGKGTEVDKVKEQLLQSNPVLEGEVFRLYSFSIFLYCTVLQTRPFLSGHSGFQSFPV